MAVLVVPGLHNSGPGHWQTWLQQRSSRAWRVEQSDWTQPDLDAWVDGLTRALRLPRAWRSCYHEPVIAVAHSFGCLALARYLSQQGAGVDAALFVAPALPRAVQIDAGRLTGAVRCPAIVVASSNDPWSRADETLRLASRWGASLVNVGAAGHLNVESGHGPWPFAQRLVQVLSQRVAAQRRWQSESVEVRQVMFAV